MKTNLGNKKIFSANLDFYMKKFGKTRSEICDALGFNYATFSDWANGRNYPRIDKIEKLANYFGILKSDLIEERIEKNHDNMYSYDEIGNIIRQRRTELNMTQAELGEKLGVGKTAVAKWEAGKVKNLKRDALQQLADVLQISPLVLIGINTTNDAKTISVQEADMPPDAFERIERHIICEKNNQKCIVVYEIDFSKEDFSQIEQFIAFMKNKKIQAQFIEFMKQQNESNKK